ncbi:hypothetical protein BG006_004457 [Podila minutissima]|uniref:Uncharacterized protein n=1 Tax=Podila minutissima TaxID=64525 RepID=A0A9P5VMX6_9FUNG|nr:hypothetical protein BG006_004457 [Podila minutissima]
MLMNACDAKGDQIHQPLMAKKMQRLEASSEFRPFKFRIQAFTNAFHDSLIQHGLTEDILPLRKVKIYLWRHRYISRFNEDGKKQKSKGNHVWNIEARKIKDSGQQSSTSTPVSAGGGGSVASLTPMSTFSGGTTSTNAPSPVRWEFREYTSRIVGQLNKFAKVGVPYVYTPKIWDAQMSCPIAEYSSPDLPAWLLWHNGELRGTPGPDDESCTITIMAKYLREGENCVLEMAFPLTVSDPSKESELQDSGDEDEDELEDDDDEYPVATSAMTGGSAQAVVVPAPIATEQVMLAQASEDVSPRRAWKTTKGPEDEPDVQNGGDVSEDIGDEDQDDDEDEEDESPSSRRASGGSGRKLLASTTERNDSKRRKQV